MNVVVDIGNTRKKYAFFDNTRLVAVGYNAEQLFDDLRQLKSQGEDIDVFLSGSGIWDESFVLPLKKIADSWLEASPQMPLPMVINYATPETLGFDRIANCVGAMALFPACPLLVIDSGTAITYNYVSGDGIFMGGNISPGMEMRFRGLHQFTARLPYVEPEKEYGGIGQTTETAIRNGVMDGLLFEVCGYIERFVALGSNSRVIITGGNSCFLRGRVRPEVCFYEELGFLGLNCILEEYKKTQIRF